MSKILIIKLAAIGDVIMALPMVEEIKKECPSAEITWVEGMKRYFIKEPGKRNFPISTRHFTDEYTRLILNDDCNAKITLSAVVPNLCSGKFTDFLTKFKNRSIIAIVPGGAKNCLADDMCRRWPIDNYVQLVRLILQQGYEVVLIGADSDAWVRPYFKNLPVQDLIGKTNLLELVEIYQHCDLVITHDSGPMHLAGLAGTKLLALFGPTNPYEKIPRGRQVIKFIWDVDQYACCPCYDGKTYANCQNNICLKNILPERVLEVAIKILKESKY